jgi:NADH-quinone oxidoreductase subunit J
LLFLILGAEFLFVLFLIVYVGAIAILFLFVIMLLNLRVVESYNTFYNYMPIGVFVAFYFMLFILFFLVNDFTIVTPIDFNLLDNYSKNWVSFIFLKSNIYSIGELLYNYYNHFFILAGLILLIALIGVITLTLTKVPLPKDSFYNYKRVSRGGFSS